MNKSIKKIKIFLNFRLSDFRQSQYYCLKSNSIQKKSQNSSLSDVDVFFCIFLHLIRIVSIYTSNRNVR